MGKDNFPVKYCNIRRELKVAKEKTPTIKVSGLCDPYQSTKNYAGIMVYHSGDSCRWLNEEGIAEGYTSQAPYVLITCTDNWTAEDYKRAGQGYVHDKMHRLLFNENFQDGITCCAGFAILKGKRHYSSHWLNDQSNMMEVNKWSWTTDGSHLASKDEIPIINAAINKWIAKGPGSIASVPKATDYRLRALGSDI